MKITYLILILFVLYSCSKKEKKILPTEMDLTESVYSSVIIQPDSLYEVYTTIAGIIDYNFVEEGDLVKKDEALIQIINNTPEINTENARLTLELAKKNLSGSAAILESIKKEIDAAALTFINDSINYFRQKNLWEQNIGSKVEFDTKKLKYQLSQNNLKLLNSKYIQTQNELQTALQQAQNNYRTSLINTEDYKIKSKINGKVYALYKEPGEIVTTMEPIASIGSADKFIIEMLVDEVDIVKISENQEVIVNLDAYNNDVFTGRVSKIFPKKDEYNQTFKVEAYFDKAPKVLYPGLSGEANIIIAKKSNVLTIPKSYVTEENKVKTDTGFVHISVGLQNLEYIEVISGITKDTYIYPPEK